MLSGNLLLQKISDFLVFHRTKIAIEKAFPEYNKELKDKTIAGVIKRSEDERKRKREEIQRASFLGQTNRLLMNIIPDFNFYGFFASNNISSNNNYNSNNNSNNINNNNDNDNNNNNIRNSNINNNNINNNDNNNNDNNNDNDNDNDNDINEENDIRNESNRRSNVRNGTIIVNKYESNTPLCSDKSKSNKKTNVDINVAESDDTCQSAQKDPLLREREKEKEREKAR